MGEAAFPQDLSLYPGGEALLFATGLRSIGSARAGAGGGVWLTLWLPRFL